MCKPSVFIEPVSDGRGRVLDRLAAALGGSADSLFGASAQPTDSMETHELLSLWLCLRTDRARARVLASLRAEVTAQAD